MFSHHFKENSWNNAESVSGAGSTLAYTRNLRAELPRLAEDLGISSIFDAPCGDFNWLKTVVWPSGRQIRYIGGDIVRALIDRNQELYGDGSRSFIHFDILKQPPPKADLWLCRDCLFHFSDRDIFAALNNFVDSGIPYLLTSLHPKCDRNTDIRTGMFRCLNLLLPPFELSPPLRLIDDWIEGQPMRQLALWDKESVRRSLASNPAFTSSRSDARP